MKNINVILICLILYTFSIKKGLGQVDSTIHPFVDIQLVKGCYSLQYYNISIISQKGKLIAKKYKPNYYYGSNTDSIWTAVLDINRIAVIERFIEKAEELNGECPYVTTSEEKYIIDIHNDTTYRVHGHCDWDTLDYFYIEKLLFKEHFYYLKKKREVLVDSFKKGLNGHWIVTGLDKNLKQNDTVTMWRTDEMDNIEFGTIVWMFSDSLKFKSFENSQFDLTYSKYYELNVKNRYNKIRIGPGAVIDEKGMMTIENDGANFEILQIEPDKITLKYWWR